MGCAYLMMAPWEAILPKELWVVLVSLPIMGLGQAMIYSKNYLVPTYPHLIRSASEDYGYAHDDILVDALSGLSNIACDVGEIIGPIFAGVMADIIGMENTGVIVAFSCFAYAGVYLIGSGLIGKLRKKRKDKVNDEKMLSTESD